MVLGVSGSGYGSRGLGSGFAHTRGGNVALPKGHKAVPKVRHATRVGPNCFFRKAKAVWHISQHDQDTIPGNLCVLFIFKHFLHDVSNCDTVRQPHRFSMGFVSLVDPTHTTAYQPHLGLAIEALGHIGILFFLSPLSHHAITLTRSLQNAQTSVDNRVLFVPVKSTHQGRGSQRAHVPQQRAQQARTLFGLDSCAATLVGSSHVAWSTS